MLAHIATKYFGGKPQGRLEDKTGKYAHTRPVSHFPPKSNADLERVAQILKPTYQGDIKIYFTSGDAKTFQELKRIVLNGTKQRDEHTRSRRLLFEDILGGQ